LKINKKEVDLLLLSDVHFDSRYCQRDLLKKHLDEAKKNGAYVMVFGDWFDVMGCDRDPRSKGQDIREEYLQSNRSYLDLIVTDAFEFLLPYKDNLIFMGYGNHETNIQRRRDTDILNTLVFLLRQQGSPVVKGGYSGYINMELKRSSTSYVSSLMAYHHGYGGNAPRSKGILRSQLDALVWSDADIIVSGHDHNKMHDFNTVLRRQPATGKIEHVKKHWIKTGNYKRNERTTGMGGWEVEKGFIPKPIGGYFMNLKAISTAKKNKEGKVDQKAYVQTTVIEAQ